MQGQYSSVVQRETLSSTAGTNYYVKLRSFYNECHIYILLDSHILQKRISMDNLANVITLSGGTGTAAATINYANIVCKVLKLLLDIASNRLIAMTKKQSKHFTII